MTTSSVFVSCDKEITADTGSQLMFDGVLVDVTDITLDDGSSIKWSLALLIKANDEWTVSGCLLETEKEHEKTLVWRWNKEISPWNEDFRVSAKEVGIYEENDTVKSFTSTTDFTAQPDVDDADLDVIYKTKDAAFCIQWMEQGADNPESYVVEAGLLGVVNEKLHWWRGGASPFQVNSDLFFYRYRAGDDDNSELPSRSTWYLATDSLI